ncbi:MAG TPA: hypothetical protein VFR06_04465 [Gallionellaceae bacterium]|nr:hypothetical protein [Gallionellaceae bacterium]
MLSLPLAPTDDQAKPAFRNVATLTQWLAQLQLTNLHAAHQTLRKQLDEFNRLAVSPTERLHTLELLRETVAIVQADYARKLVVKKLPLNTDELTILVSILGLWQGMQTGYRRCLQAFIDGDKHLAQQGPLLCHRCLLYGSLQIFEYLRTGYEFDGILWQQLHELFSFIEGNGLQHDKVADEVHTRGYPLSCHTLYAKMLLICHAHPSELSRAQLQLLDRWLTQWGEVIHIERRYSLSKGDAPPLALDLGGNQGLQALEQVTQSDRLRFLAMVPLSKLLRVKTILLQQGQAPQQLELGTEFFGVDCIAFLNLLHQFWCEGFDHRLVERRSVSQQAQVGFGMELVYALISGRPYQRSAKDIGADTITRKEQLATLGRSLESAAQPASSYSETWAIENENILGARLLRNGVEGERVGLNQLVAVKPDNANAYIVGTVKWRSVTRSDQLRAGAHYFPGVAQPVTLKHMQSGDNKQSYGLLLPALTSQKIPASLIVPRDVFQAERTFEMILPNNDKQLIRMGFSVITGADFERVSFAPA